MAEHFARYADATQPASPLYGRLLAGCARDPDILALAATSSPGQPAALLLLAAVHYLLLANDRASPPARAVLPERQRYRRRSRRSLPGLPRILS